MTRITDGWFKLDLGDNGGFRRLTFPWMTAPDEESVQLSEAHGFIFIDNKIFLPKDALPAAVSDLMRSSPAVHGVLGARGLDDIVELLAPAESETSGNEHTLTFSIGDIRIRRIVAAHSVHPVPVVTHIATNESDRPVNVNYYWCLGTDSNCYGVLSEKGDTVPPVHDRLGGESSIFFIKMLRSLRADSRHLAWSFINLNFGDLQPGASKTFRVSLWSLKHLWVGTQFSGFAFAVSDQDPTTAVAAVATAPGRNADSVSWLFSRLYSPIFVLDGNSLSKETRDILSRAPIRLLLTNRRLDPDSLTSCVKNGTRVVMISASGDDPFVAVQQSLDQALAPHDSSGLPDFSGCPYIVNVLPDGIDRQLLLGYYYSLRRDMMRIGDRFTVPVRNLFIQASSLPDQKYADLMHGASFIRLFGSKLEITDGIVDWLEQYAEVLWHSFDVATDRAQQLKELLTSRGLEYVADRVSGDNMTAHVVSFYANHDYALARLAAEGLLDLEHSPSQHFSKVIEQVTGESDLWEVPVGLVQKHGQLEIFGPPFSTLVPTSQWGDGAIFNAALGAQYAKAIRACIFPLHHLPESNQRRVRQAFEELRRGTYELEAGKVNWDSLANTLQLISAELAVCFDTLTKALLHLAEYSEHARPSYGQRGIYLFHGDHTLPFELVSRHEAFNRANTVGIRTLFGRMAFPSPKQTSLYCSESILFQQCWYPENKKVVLAWDPTGDLLGSMWEQSSVAVALGRIGITPIQLTGLTKKAILEEKLKTWPIASSGPFQVSESAVDAEGNTVEERTFHLESPEECTVESFSRGIAQAGGVHFTGHGGYAQNIVMRS